MWCHATGLTLNSYAASEQKVEQELGRDCWCRCSCIDIANAVDVRHSPNKLQ